MDGRILLLVGMVVRTYPLRGALLSSARASSLLASLVLRVSLVRAVWDVMSVHDKRRIWWCSGKRRAAGLACLAGRHGYRGRISVEHRAAAWCSRLQCNVPSFLLASSAPQASSAPAWVVLVSIYDISIVREALMEWEDVPLARQAQLGRLGQQALVVPAER